MGHSSPNTVKQISRVFFPLNYIGCLLFFLFSLFSAYDQNSDIAIQETRFIPYTYIIRILFPPSGRIVFKMFFIKTHSHFHVFVHHGKKKPFVTRNLKKPITVVASKII